MNHAVPLAPVRSGPRKNNTTRSDTTQSSGTFHIGAMR